AVLEIDATKREEVLGVLIGILSKVVNLGEDKEEMTFAKAEPFYLLNVDMFNLELDLDNRSYSREDIQNLVAINKKLVEKIYISIDNNEAEARRIYETYIKPLPDSRTLWKLRLYVITRCPQFFEAEIKEALLRLFNAEERYFDINSGTEYHYSLMAGFALLDKDFKREYIKKVFEYFGADLNDKDKEGWRKRDGLILATYIKADMNKTEIAHSEVLFGKFPDKAPIPDTGMSEVAGGFVNHKSPFTLSDFNVDQIIEHLKTDWDPKLLNEKFKNDDFLNPRGTEGLGDALKDDLKLRTQDYFTKLNAFFDRTAIDPSYVYSLMRGVDEMLRNKQSLSDVQYVALINFFDSIRVSGEKEEFKKFDDKKSWLADWITVHKIMADILLNSLGYINESEVFTKNRDIILNLVKYLLSIKSSPNSEEEKPEYGEPSHIAINSVRGQAYRALVQFTYNDGKSLAGDVKRIYEDVLDSDSSTAVRFTAGQFLASFYFRDKAFIKSLLPKIFPKDTVGKEKLYFATWEGYLASALYEELYELLAEYYEYAITLKKEQYPERKYLKGLDETLAGHMALAYAQFNLKIGDPLFNSFWNTPSETRHYEFTSFTGRHYLTRSQAGDEWMAENKVSKTKIIDFWNWILKTEIPVEAKTFSGFGFWVNPDKEVISDEIVIVNMAESLKKSLGVIDWDYGLLQRINKFAEINPEKTLEIIARLLILNDGLNPHHRTYFDASRQIKEPLEIIYKIPSLKKPVEDLVNMLIEKGSSTFWDLKKIMTE
ncbi:MAG: hypothetical protein NT077_01455, partial [Candidatus Taylorbacteria bacterium]|nr:hypothetical protein [Candidatus Taylorbacteria bacterium]